MLYSTRPTNADPVVVLLRNAETFCCWVESSETGDRWVFVSPGEVRYRGPLDDGERSISEIRDLVEKWWTTKQRLARIYFGVSN